MVMSGCCCAHRLKSVLDDGDAEMMEWLDLVKPVPGWMIRASLNASGCLEGAQISNLIHSQVSDKGGSSSHVEAASSTSAPELRYQGEVSATCMLRQTLYNSNLHLRGANEKMTREKIKKKSRRM
jgi:hypothetical protein